MKVTEIEKRKSTKHQNKDGCLQKNTVEQKEYGEALIEEQMAEKNINTTSNRSKKRLLEEILEPENLNIAYQRVKRNKGAGGVDGMNVDELYTYLILSILLYTFFSRMFDLCCFF